ncbi:MAG: YdaU family protein [Pseudomonadota bacterium]|nr:YdaU family protein [Pseudomonadota bacterium]MDE3037781.1 YdaU family protein [Pseudomonadota bacterium]
MGKPPYMRFYPDAYCKDTLNLSMEEQGVYMRLLCTMWRHGGKIQDDDRLISRALPVNLNKWLKVKPRIAPYLAQHSPGFLTQNRLRVEYAFSSGRKKESNAVAQGAAPPAAWGVAPPVAPLAAQGVAPHVDNSGGKNEDVENSEELQAVDGAPERGVAHALARALDQSKSKSDKNKTSRFLEDGGGDSCGKTASGERSVRFVNQVIALFENHKLQPPGDYGIIVSWVENGCDLFLHILPAVEAVLQSRAHSAADPPKSWRYFAHEVYARKKSKKEK